jgi:hypothetical protein
MSGCRPEHLARFVVEIVEQLDLRALESAYRGSGKAAYHPEMLTVLLIYGYATGTYSSRAIEKASHDSVAFCYIAANQSQRKSLRTSEPTTVLADAGYFSQANVERCLARDVRPLIAKRRDQHYRPWLDCLAEPPTIDTAAGPVERMAHDMQSRDGRDLYRLRKQTVEPVFGIIKFVMRFRQFLLRGLSKATGE